MNKLHTEHNAGYPFDVAFLAFMQNGYRLFNSLGSMAGNKAIISGCKEVGNTITPGTVYINGELLPFEGGTKDDTVWIREDTTQVTFQDGFSRMKSNKNLEQLLTGKVDKEEGKGLSQENFTKELANKIIELEKQVNVFKSIIDKDGDDIIIKTTPNIRLRSIPTNIGTSICFKIFEEAHDICISKDSISLGEKRLYTSADITNPSLNEFITNSVVYR